MTPYYQDDLVTIYHGRCEDALPLVTPDLVVTSPPFNLGPVYGTYANMQEAYASYADNLPEAQYVQWQRDVIALLWDQIPDNGAIFYNHKPVLRDGVARLPTRLLPPDVLLRQIVIWDRGNGMNWNESHFLPQHEWIMLLAKPDFRLASRQSGGDVWRIPSEREGYGHPCPFPVALAARAIAATAARSVLDPFMGVGSTLVAAKALGRFALGIEIEERYCEAAALRCSQEVLSLSEPIVATMVAQPLRMKLG